MLIDINQPVANTNSERQAAAPKYPKEFGRKPIHIFCTNCQQQVKTRMTVKRNFAWYVYMVILIFSFPLVLLCCLCCCPKRMPCRNPDCHDHHHRCANCDVFIGAKLGADEWKDHEELEEERKRKEHGKKPLMICCPGCGKMGATRIQKEVNGCFWLRFVCCALCCGCCCLCLVPFFQAGSYNLFHHCRHCNRLFGVKMHATEWKTAGQYHRDADPKYHPRDKHLNRMVTLFNWFGALIDGKLKPTECVMCWA